ncbi:MAG: hypothetical protein DWQ04_02200 [Chloroflexi bacterium]|nr:MAG: hypothetical protein DWQ04_02200 [Chloroflexota bacterium]
MSQTISVGCLYAIWGEALAELNDMDKALELVKKGAELTLRGGDVAMFSWSHLCLMRVLLSTGDMVGAEETIQKIKVIDRKLDLPPWFMNQMAAKQVQIYLKRGEVETAVQFITQRNLPLGEAFSLQHEFEYFGLARVLFAQRKWKEASELLQQLLESAEAGGRTTKIIESLILQALTFHASGGVDTAVTQLKLALDTAKSHGYIRIFVDEGPPMVQLLYEALSRGIATDYVQQLLAAFLDAEPEQTAFTKKEGPASEWVEPLSDREVEVLQLIAEGLTNREIGNRLFLTLNTVKAHTRTIYRKLNVNRRTRVRAEKFTEYVLRQGIEY